MIGLQNFEIKNLNLNLVRLSLTFDFEFPQLQIDGQHTTTAVLGTIPISGAGAINMVFNDFRMNGTAYLNTVNGGFLNLKRMVVSTQVSTASATLRGFGFLLDPLVSAGITAALPSLINDGDSVNNLIEDSIVPSLNEQLNHINLIEIIFSILFPGIIRSSGNDLLTVEAQIMKML